MTPIDDPRRFAEVLRDWMARHGRTLDTAGEPFGWARATTVRRLRNKDEPPDGRMARALMSLIDEERATITPPS